MKKKIILLVIICVVALCILEGCAKPNWECEDFKYLGESVDTGPIFEVGGNTYCYLPETFWIPFEAGKSTYLGWVYTEENIYPGGYYIDIYSHDADNKMFVTLYTAEKQPLFGETTVHVTYHRSDVKLPPFDRTGINKVGFVKEGEWEEKKFIQDKDIIDKLFDSIDSVSQGFNIYKSASIGSIVCMNSNYPGIVIEVPVYAYVQDYWLMIKPPERGYNGWSVIDNIKQPETVYAKVPQELLEQIAGQKLPTPSEYIASQQKTAG
jgi:hypothetical protein